MSLHPRPQRLRPVRLRQVALVARELEPVVADLCAVLDLDEPFRDPGVATFGLHNGVLAMGDTFLEVVSPVREDTAAGRLLERRGGDAGYMVILQVDDLEAAEKRVAEQGVRVVWRTSLPDIATIHLHPRDVGGAILSLDQARPPESWRWGGPEWGGRRGGGRCLGLAGAVLAVPDPAATATRWASLVDRSVQEAGEGRVEIALDDARLLFAPPGPEGREGLVEVEIDCVEPAGARAEAARRGLAVEDDAVVVAGTRLRLVPG